MESCFRLFWLPQLAFQHVVEQFGLAEKFFMSLCSKRTYRLMKNYRNKPDAIKINVNVSYGDNDLVISREGNGQKESVNFRVENASRSKPLSIENHIYLIGQKVSEQDGILIEETNLYLHWNDWLDGIKMITDHVTSLFASSVYDICLIDREYPDRVKKLAELVMSRQHTVKRLTCKFRKMSDEDISRILNACIPTKSLRLYQDDSREFQLKFPPYNLQKFVTSGTVKLTSDHLKSFNCQDLYASKANMSMEDMNGFLKHWMNGGSFRTKQFCIGMEQFNMAVLFDGIEMVEMDNEVVRMFPYAPGHHLPVPGGFDITRNDGKVATIQNPDNLPAHFNSLIMLVWD